MEFKYSLPSRFAGRVAKQTRLVAGAHIFNAPWRSRLERRKVRYKVTRESALRYLARYNDYIRGINPEAPAPDPEPERVFSIWLQGEENAPEIVKACFRSMRRHLRQEVVVLDEKSLFDWIQLPEHIIKKWKSGKMSAAHFCDVCRVELIYQHGGIWLDATDYVTSPIPQWIMDEDFFIFMAGSTIRGSYSYVQNCFFRARKHNPLLGVWRKAIWKYWQHENSVVNYFTHHFLFKLSVEQNPAARREFEKMPRREQDPTHTVWYAHKNEPFDSNRYEEMISGAFFQKTDYKAKDSIRPVPGSFAEKMIEM